ncbi:hypothetical protein FR932_09935 [Moritella marina ATCC 15381]|uniref:Uncharacterized protein n=1 Tax=Moritella marina ATCC 15381 TaxID=1202962 RepID=A0A5J6WM60_MORMI|nr:hypothetical protein [Moritella marina]QFI38140.1 hypothetical protein FR932_09935 [Moritella marina ATCC 15381]
MALKLLGTNKQISIQTLIRSWEGRLTWDLLVTKINVELGISITRQTLDQYSNIKNEFKEKKRLLRGKPVVQSNIKLLSYLQSDIDMAQKIIQLENKLAVIEDEVGYLQAFINKISNIAQSNPIAMDIFQKTLSDIQANTKR